MEIFENAWIIGIGGGIISGLIVFFVTSKIFSKKENREYSQKIKMANKELLYSIRPLIVGQQIPSQDLIDSLIFSTARKYEVKIDDLYENEEFAEDLTKEILDNPFLNSENKLKFCNLASQLRELGLESENELKKGVIYIQKGKTISKESFSTTMSLMTAMTVLLVTIFSSKLDIQISEIPKTEWIGGLAALTTVPLLALLFTKILKLTQRIRETKTSKPTINHPVKESSPPKSDK